MAQSLEVQIKATSEVPQAVDRAKEAITSLEKRAASAKVTTAGGAVEQTATKATAKVESQFDKIGKAFGNTISSVFLSFLGPLAIITGIISFISNSIAEAKQLASDGLNKIAEGKTKLATEEESKMAAFFKAKDEREKEEREVKAGREEMTRRFLEETEAGRRIKEEADRYTTAGFEADHSKDPAFQRMALEAFLASPEGKKYASFFEAEKATKENAFRAPEGFSNVVGVGANPVLQALDETLAEAKKQTELLDKIASQGQQSSEPDFTKQEVKAQYGAATMSTL
jgi:hypothetical protein